MGANDRVATLIDHLITKFSGAGNSEKGSLSRALKNSSKLKCMFKAEVKRDMHHIAELSEKCSCSASYVPQRWDSILTMLRLMSTRIDALLEFLCKLATSCDRDAAVWAQGLLRIFTLPNIILLALLTEFVTICQGHIHEFDNKGGSVGHRSSACKPSVVRRIIDTCALAHDLRVRLARMFDYKWQETKHTPLVLDPGFETGYVQMVCTALRVRSSLTLLVAIFCFAT